MSSTAAPALNPKRSKTFLTTKDAAEYLGLQRTTLEAWRCRGGGPKFGKFGRSVRYKLTDLEAWVELRTRSNTSEKGEA